MAQKLQTESKPMFSERYANTTFQYLRDTRIGYLEVVLFCFIFYLKLWKSKWMWFPIFLPSTTVVAERLCFYRCLSTGGGLHPPGQTSPRTEPPRADPLGRHPLPLMRHPPGRPSHPSRHPPPRRPLQQTISILLECILVQIVLCSVKEFMD